MQTRTIRPATCSAHPLAGSSPLNGHASQAVGSKTIGLFSANGATAPSRVLLQRPIARVEPFAPGAGLGYVARRSLDLQKPLLPGASPLLGGFEFWNFRVPPAGVLVAQLNRNGSPSWRIRGNAGNGSRYFGLWLLPRAAFSTSHDGVLAMSQIASLSVRIGTNHRHHFAARFAVQNGDGFYLSRAATDRLGQFALQGGNLAEQFWAAYQPLLDLRANMTPEGWTSSNSVHGGAALLPFATPTSALGDIQAIGLYAEAIDRSTAGDRCLEWDELQATVAG